MDSQVQNLFVKPFVHYAVLDLYRLPRLIAVLGEVYIGNKPLVTVDFDIFYQPISVFILKCYRDVVFITSSLCRDGEVEFS